MTEEEMIARGQEMFAKCYGDVLPAPKRIESATSL